MPSPAELAPALLTPGLPPPPGLAPAERFAVHRNNVVAGLIEVLAAAYPAVRALVGEPFFRALAASHVRAAPPTSPVLIVYGAGFPAFVERFPPARRLPYLADVARLERAWREAYHAAEAAPLPLAALAALPPEDVASAGLTLHPSLRIVASAWPAHSLWAANIGRGEHDAVVLHRVETALVVRPMDRVEVHPIDPGSAVLVRALAQRASLGAAAEAALAADPAFDLAAALGQLFAAGAVTGIAPIAQRSAVP